jgi:uncharacterized membrane protein
MAHIEKSVTINAPVDVVDGYMAQISKLPEWYTNMLEVRNLSADTIATGVTYEWAFKMVGIRFDGKSRYTDVVRKQHVRLETEGGIPSKWEWRFAADGNHTKLSVTVDYTVPGKLLGKIADKLFIERRNVRDLEHALANVKEHCEAVAEAKAAV